MRQVSNKAEAGTGLPPRPEHEERPLMPKRTIAPDYTEIKESGACFP
jgi:hypothetical protein